MRASHHGGAQHLMARIAADAYFDSAKPQQIENLSDRCHAFRSWEFSAQLSDTERMKAKGLILTLHREGLTSDGKLWWMAYDFLIDNAVRFR
jgi:hypothetical protein